METKRRDFIKGMTAAGLLTALPGILSARPLVPKPPEKIWAALLHLSFNMWEEYISPHRPFRGYRPNLELSKPLWDDALNEMAKSGVNMVVIDLGDAVKYNSYPEIAVNGAWTTDKLKVELAKIRKMGIEPIPKLNFSAGHDAWMGEYSRMVSSKPYYEFCQNIIAEVSELFDKPRFFHLGMDEEDAERQKYQLYTVIRKNDVWWNDFYFLVDQVEKNGSRAWIWPDYYLWSEPEQFLKRMPKTVVQSNWYYGEEFDFSKLRDVATYTRRESAPRVRVQGYLDLEAHGFDQIPTGSYHDNNENNLLYTVQFCKREIDDSHLLGFMQTYWRPTIEENRDRIIKGTQLIGAAKQWYEKNK